jgi:nitrite reductase/ring-hydroxylating ferredoxin subunit
MSWVDVGRAEGPDGTLREARSGSLLLGVARADGRWHVFDAYCTHAECPLTDGWLEGDAVRCACHAALFDLETGTALDGPAEQPIRLYETRVTEGRLEALLPD